MKLKLAPSRMPIPGDLADRPSFSPTLFQHIVDEEAKITAIVGPKDPLPTYQTVVDEKAEGETDGPKELNVPNTVLAESGNSAKGMLLGGIGTGVASALLYGVSLGAKSNYVNGSTAERLAEKEDPEQWAQQMQSLNTGAFWGSVAAGGSSAAMLTLHFTKGAK